MRHQLRRLLRHPMPLFPLSGLSVSDQTANRVKPRARAMGYVPKGVQEPPIGRLRAWDRCARPIGDLEGVYLMRLGEALRSLRVASGLTRSELAYGALLSPGHVVKLELGYRRTRRSTLTRIVEVLVEVDPDLGSPDDLVDRLCEVAGPALAPETAFSRQVARTLRRKRRRQEKEEHSIEREYARWFRQTYGREWPGQADNSGSG
jgi:transcriptional regulator with XRE-family HTH domain